MMLPLPNLDDQNVAEIINQALDEVRKHSGIWNDTDVHDPGVTLLELFASIKSTQQSSINTIGSRNLMKFLALLDIKAEKLSSAAVDVCFFSNNFKRLPVGLKFSSGSITYETAETVDVLPNRISCAASAGDIPDNLIDYDMRDIDRNIEVFNNNVNEYFYIGLENPLIKKRKIRLYFCLNENGIKRNPPSPEFEPLSKINWQYYGTEKGVLGWHNTHVESDETYNLLYSGYTVLKIRGTSAVYEDKNCYFLRLHCTKYGYEQPPRLSYVMFNAVKLLQKEHYALQWISIFYHLKKISCLLIIIWQKIQHIICLSIQVRTTSLWHKH